MNAQCRSRRKTMAALLAALPSVAAAQAEEPAVAPLAGVVVVSGSRIEHRSFDFPAAIDVVDTAQIRAGQIRVNASESLGAIPGLVARNRENYAQDLQISSRGFGARSAFGVRGVKLIADGIPASMPDGQGQAATFNLDMAERIEVLRGPFSAIYGNHSGGVIQLFTREGKGRPSVEASMFGGSDGVMKLDVNAQGEAGPVAYVVDTSRFETDGYRDHSAARRDQAFAKMTIKPGAASRLTFTASTLDQDDTQDPLGVTWQTFLRDPRAGEIDQTDPVEPKRTLAERYNTRKSISHRQVGASFEQRFGDDRLRAVAYGGKRQVIQFQSFSRGFQAPASHSGGVIDFDRDFHGVDINFTHIRQFGRGKLGTTVGIDYSRSTDARQGFENFIGAEFGVRGALRRDEDDVLTGFDPYVQAEWESGPWVLNAGMRHSRLKVEVDDHYLGNGDDSGAREYRKSTPVLGLLYKASPVLNVYVSAARGFETPTLNEMFYSPGGTGFNFALGPARSKHIEAGIKAIAGSKVRVNAALFNVRTSDELVVDTASGGRTSYRNAGETLRRGAELSMESAFGEGWSARLALTALKATYETAFGSVAAGSSLPGVARANMFGELAWDEKSERVGAALEAIASSKVHPDDANVETAAPGYGILNARIHAKQEMGRWRIREFVRLNNLLDRSYVGSVIVGDANKRFYEAAPGRTWLAGVSAQYQF